MQETAVEKRLGSTIDEGVKKLLLSPIRVPPFVPDEYDVDVCELLVPWEDAETSDVGLIGVPFDTAVVSRRGSRWAPQSIRQALVMWSHYNLDTGIDISSNDFSIVDFGDIDVVHTDLAETHRRIEKVLTSLYEVGSVPIMLGGDHSITYPALKALCNVHEGKIGVIGFDSHLDVRPSRHGEPSSGMPFRQALEETGGKVTRVAEIGINGWHNAKRYHDYALGQGIKIVTARDVHRAGPDTVVADVLDFVTEDTSALYLTFDVDALDIGSMPGTCIPSPGGLVPWEALDLVAEFVKHPMMRGMDLVEVSPPLDTSNSISSITGSALLMQMIGGVKARKEHNQRGKGRKRNQPAA